MNTEPYVSINDLSNAEVDLTTSLPKRLKRLWAKERETCFSDTAKRKFYERWGIELGLVENIFRWDRGVTMTLLEQGISPEILVERAGTSAEEAEKNVATIASHVETLQEVEMGFISGDTELSANFIRQLHQQLLANQETYDVFILGQGFAERELVKGAFKEQSNDPFNREPPHNKIKAYCPPESTEGEVIKLCDLYRSDLIQSASPEVRAAWLHHRFTQIHPFVDGNGRIARTLASLVLVKAGLPPLIVRRDEDRSTYLDALEKADQGSLSSLVDIVIERVRTEILHLIKDAGSVQDALEEAKRSLLQRIELRKDRADSIFTYIHAGSVNKFNGLQREIQNVLHQGRRSTEPFKVEDRVIAKPGDKAAHAFDEIVLSQKYGYEPHVADISGYVRISIVTDYRFVILVHLHERDIMDGGGFVVAAMMIEEELEDGAEQTISQIPIDPLFISVEKSGDINSLQRDLQEFAAQAVELGISFWGRSQ